MAQRVKILTLALVIVASVSGAARAQDTADEETQLGAQVFQQLKQEHEIVASSPLYDTLRPISDAITRVIQPQYEHPIHFYIVHEKQPNAFAAPGGNIYVVDSLFTFVHNTEELAGTICHETSHLIHHDSVHKMDYEQGVRRREILATILTGASVRSAVLANAIGKLDALHYSRGEEESADLKGSDTCAAAGFNPWGLVWLFDDFSNSNIQAPPEILSDHPGDQHRMEALEQHFAEDPKTFSRFSSDPKTAKPLKLPKKNYEKILK